MGDEQAVCNDASPGEKKEGAVNVTFTMPAEWAKELERAANNGELSKYKITGAQIIEAVDASPESKSLKDPIAAHQQWGHAEDRRRGRAKDDSNPSLPN